MPAMPTIDDVAAMARELPDVVEAERHERLTWWVNGKAFAWDRPFTKADIRRFGDSIPPDGPILAVGVADLVEKEAVLAASSKAVFTIPHFEGYAALLIQLNTVTTKTLRALVIDAWLARAPSRLANEYLEAEDRRR